MLSGKNYTKPTSWSAALRRDLKYILEWMMALRVEGADSLLKLVPKVDSAIVGFRVGSKALRMMAGIDCRCDALPHKPYCTIWKRLKFGEHFWSEYGMTPSTDEPPVGYGEDVIQFPKVV